MLFRNIIILITLMVTAFFAYQKDILTAVVWGGAFILQLVMYAVDIIKDHIDKTFKSE